VRTISAFGRCCGLTGSDRLPPAPPPVPAAWRAGGRGSGPRGRRGGSHPFASCATEASRRGARPWPGAGRLRARVPDAHPLGRHARRCRGKAARGPSCMRAAEIASPSGSGCGLSFAKPAARERAACMGLRRPRRGTGSSPHGHARRCAGSVRPLPGRVAMGAVGPAVVRVRVAARPTAIEGRPPIRDLLGAVKGL